MNKTTLYLILGVTLGILVGFVLVMYLLRPSPPTLNVETPADGAAIARLAGPHGAIVS